MIILVSSCLLTYFILTDYVSIANMNHSYVIPEYIESSQQIGDITLNINDTSTWGSVAEIKISKDDFYSITDGIRTFMVSDTDESYNYWFVTRKKIWDVAYLYSHNSYKYTENSWYYIYNNWKEWTKIKLNNGDEYEVYTTSIFDFNKWEYPKIMDMNTKIVYFTCTPFWDNVRKAFFLKRIGW